MDIIYIAHPIGGDVEANLADLRRIIKELNFRYPDLVIFCPYYADVVSLDDSDPVQRERGIRNDTELIKRGFISEVWLTGTHISKGMEAEAELPRSLQIPVFNYTNVY